MVVRALKERFESFRMKGRASNSSMKYTTLFYLLFVLLKLLRRLFPWVGKAQ